MKVKDVVQKLDLKVFSAQDALQNEVTGGYTSDLLSDVMGHSSEGELWITLQTHKNIMGVASLKDLAGVILVKGFEPDKDTIELSENEGVPILGSSMSAFELSGKLYAALNDKL